MPVVGAFTSGPCAGQTFSLDVQPLAGETRECGGHSYVYHGHYDSAAKQFVFEDTGVTITPPPPPGGTPPPAATGAAVYALVGSYPTVQVLSPTLVNNVQYCTIQTVPSGVVASKTVQESVFDTGQAGPELLAFAQAIEQVMTDDRVTAAVGTPTREDNGLLADSVVFTVTYTDPVRAPYGVQGDATIGVNQLNFADATVGQTFLADIRAVIDSVYANLQAAAGG